jgi:protein regulator of cytokinesis 1
MREVWMEVSNEVIEALEVDFKKAREERVSWDKYTTELHADEQDNRRTQLLSDFVDLHWLHDELALPPLPNGTGSHSFPIELLPDRHNEETPGAYQAYEKTLGHFIANFKEENVEREIVEKEPKITEDGNVEEEEDDEGDKGRVLDLKGLEDLQPEVGLINWINELSGLVCRFCGFC